MRRLAPLSLVISCLGACAAPCNDDGLRQSCPVLALVETTTSAGSSSDGGTTAVVHDDDDSTTASDASASASDDDAGSSSSEGGHAHGESTGVEQTTDERGSTGEQGSAGGSSGGGDVGICEAWGVGAYGGCIDRQDNVDLTECESDQLGCIVDDPDAETVSVCIADCEQPCDCPAPPPGHEAQVSCEDLDGQAGNECFLACLDDGDCPGTMVCFGGALCMHPL